MGSERSHQGPVWRRVRGPALALALGVGVLAAVAWQGSTPVGAVPLDVDQGPVVEAVHGRGTLEAEREAQLGFDLVGRISDVRVDEGERVSLGQELAGLEIDAFEAQRQTAVSSVAAAKATLRRLASEEERARATFEQAEREAERTRRLVQSGSEPVQAGDLAQDQVRIARADLDRVLASRTEATRGVDVASHRTEESRTTLRRATLLAPFDGIVIQRFHEPGDTVTVGTTVLRLVATHRVIARLWIDEQRVGRVEVGSAVRVVLADGATRGGRVTEVGWEADREAHEVPVEVALDAPPDRFAYGARVDGWIEVGRRDDAVRIATDALRWDGPSAWVYVDEAGRIARRDVEASLYGEDVVAVAGLAPGDRVLVAPQPGAALPLGRRWAAP